MKIFQRILAVVLSLTLVLSYSIPSDVEASSTTKLENELNLKYTGENSWEYIQKKDGEVYKIIEEIDPSTGEVTRSLGQKYFKKITK